MQAGNEYSASPQCKVIFKSCLCGTILIMSGKFLFIDSCLTDKPQYFLDHITVCSKDDIRFCLRSGQEI